MKIDFGFWSLHGKIAVGVSFVELGKYKILTIDLVFWSLTVHSTTSDRGK